MRTYIDGPDGAYWGLTTEDFAKWATACGEEGYVLELTGISPEGELYYRRYYA